jgi:hypothetical protein
MIVSVPVCTWENASRQRRVEHGRSERVHPLRQAATRARADRAHVDPDPFGGEAGQDPVGARGNRLEHAVVGEGREEDVGGLGDLARGVAPLQPVVHKFVRLLSMLFLSVDRVPGGEETGRHAAAHVPKADEADLCRR